MPTNAKLEGQMAAEGYIPVREAATRLSVSVYTVYRRLRLGMLKGAVVDGHRFVLFVSMDKYRRSTSDAEGLKLQAKRGR
jgi:hypothetical protein